MGEAWPPDVTPVLLISQTFMLQKSRWPVSWESLRTGTHVGVGPPWGVPLSPPPPATRGTPLWAIRPANPTADNPTADPTCQQQESSAESSGCGGETAPPPSPPVSLCL